MRNSGATVRLFVFNLILAICFTILLTAPGIQFLSTHILGYPHDGFAYMWKMWWWREALWEHRLNPSNLSYVNYPYQGQNLHLVASPFINLLSLPLVGWLGSLRSYNILLLAAFALSWPAAALLCYEFFGSRWAASLGGAIYAFYPNKVAHAVGGHLAQTFDFLFPLGVFFLFRAWKSPERRSNGLLAGVFLALSILVDLKHIALFIAPLLFLFLLFYGFTERRKWNFARFTSMGFTFVIAALIAAPFLAPMILGRLGGRLGHLEAESAVRHSADLTSFLIPPPEHPIYSSLEPLRAYSAALAQEGWHENIFYLGLMTVLLSMIGARRRWNNKDVKFWSIVAISGIILALGPYLKVGGELLSFRMDDSVGYLPMPYYLLQRLPFYDWGRTPGRMIEMTMLALTVLAAAGAAVLLDHCKKNWRSVAALGMITVVLLDSLFIWPWPLGDAQTPSFYRGLALDGEDYAILDLPLWEYRCERYQVYYATTHGQPIVGGSIGRRSPEAEVTMRRVERSALPQSDGDTASALADLGIRYVILHKRCLEGPQLKEKSEYLTTELAAPVYDDRWIRAFEVPGDPTIPARWLQQLQQP